MHPANRNARLPAMGRARCRAIGGKPAWRRTGILAAERAPHRAEVPAGPVRGIETGSSGYSSKKVPLRLIRQTRPDEQYPRNRDATEITRDLNKANVGSIRLIDRIGAFYLTPCLANVYTAGREPRTPGIAKTRLAWGYATLVAKQKQLPNITGIALGQHQLFISRDLPCCRLPIRSPASH